MALLGRFLFETHDAVRLRKQHYGTSDLEILSDIPYMDDGDAGHLFSVQYPLWPESRIVYQEFDNYFKICFSGIQTGIHPPLA